MLHIIHPFWFLGDTMLRVNIGPMQTSVTKKPKTSKARWKIWILGDLKLGDLVQAEFIGRKDFVFNLYRKNSLRSVTKISVT